MSDKRRYDFMFTYHIPLIDNTGLDEFINKDDLIKLHYNYLVDFFETNKDMFKFVVFQLELGETTNPLHYQGYFYLVNNKKFINVKKLFDKFGLSRIHLEERYSKSTIQACYDYCTKEDTRYVDTIYNECIFYEFGSLPSINEEENNQGKRTDLEEFKEEIYKGKTYIELQEDYLKELNKYDKFYEKNHKLYLEEKYINNFRSMKNKIIYCKDFNDLKSNIEKVYLKFGFKNVYRVTDYKNPFEDYKEQDILLLEDYTDGFSVDYLKKLLSGFPMYLKARYENKVACFTKVIILTNSDIDNFNFINGISNDFIKNYFSKDNFI